MLISNSLTKIEYDLIGNLSDSALIKLRQEHALNELLKRYQLLVKRLSMR